MRALWGLKGVILWTIFDSQKRDVAAQSQISYPICKDAALDWAYNKEGQSPCQVAAILQGVCFDNKWIMGPISIDQQYDGPMLYQSNACQCNTVVFSLATACAACQDGGAPSWTTWSSDCSDTDITIAQYPITIPLNASVPAWAYLNVTVRGRFFDFWNQEAAREIAGSNAPEIAGGTSPPPVVAKPIPNALIPTSNIGPPNPALTVVGSSSSAGQIVGGVFGGLAGLLFFVLVALILYRKQRRDTAQSEKQTEKSTYIVEKATLADAQRHMWSPSGDESDPPKYASDAQVVSV